MDNEGAFAEFINEHSTSQAEESEETVVKEKTIDQVSISPTFYASLFRTKVSRKAFLYLHFRLELILGQEYWRKCTLKFW
jgi:hypothetical protein